MRLLVISSQRFIFFSTGSIFKPVLTLVSSHSSPSLLHGLLHRLKPTVMAGERGPPFPPPPLQPQPPPPSPPNPTVKQLVQTVVARVDHIERRLGQLFQLLHTVNKKLTMVLDANDVEYDPNEEEDSDDASKTDSDNMSD